MLSKLSGPLLAAGKGIPSGQLPSVSSSFLVVLSFPLSISSSSHPMSLFLPGFAQ